LIASITTNNDVDTTGTATFSELRPLSPEYHPQTNFSESARIDTDFPLTYVEIAPIDSLMFTHGQQTLHAVHHDHAALCKQSDVLDMPSSSSDAKQTRRSSARLQQNIVHSTTTKNKRTKNVHRAKDISTSEDLSYYLERRRRNNEASKVSRAARKQRFGSMDLRW
jgi:hypothetical protein